MVVVLPSKLPRTGPVESERLATDMMIVEFYKIFSIKSRFNHQLVLRFWSLDGEDGRLRTDVSGKK